ncbi:MAG: Unknown protein [uncultured Sulfurovum sp.]|uniref:DUF6868 domain-containing protein n=1 Tax=uncultured Sulfurovum sp. TaxID=269237 RepID=A0A6S6TVT0_9BACT|nr:MAG: Unknown protein [uncultured Sulfurovum sp.]
MLTLETLIEFLGWSTLINFTFLLMTTLAIMFLREPIIKIHAELFNLNKEDLSRAYFNYVALYKILIIVFNLVPYIALKIIV